MILFYFFAARGPLSKARSKKKKENKMEAKNKNKQPNSYVNFFVLLLVDFTVLLNKYYRHSLDRIANAIMFSKNSLLVEKPGSRLNMQVLKV